MDGWMDGYCRPKGTVLTFVKHFLRVVDRRSLLLLGQAKFSLDHVVERRFEWLPGLHPLDRNGDLLSQQLVLPGVRFTHMPRAVVDGVEQLGWDRNRRGDGLVHTVLRLHSVVARRLWELKGCVLGRGARTGCRARSQLRMDLLQVGPDQGILALADGDVPDDVQGHARNVLGRLKGAPVGDARLGLPQLDELDRVPPYLGRVDRVQEVGRHQVLDELLVLAEPGVRRQLRDVVVRDDAAELRQLARGAVKLLGPAEQDLLRGHEVGDDDGRFLSRVAERLHDGAVVAGRHLAEQRPDVAVAKVPDEQRHVSDETLGCLFIVWNAWDGLRERLAVCDIN